MTCVPMQLVVQHMKMQKLSQHKIGTSEFMEELRDFLLRSHEERGEFRPEDKDEILDLGIFEK